VRRTVSHYSKEDDGTEDRLGRFVAILSAGIERLVARERNDAESAGRPVDFGANLSVTTECQSKGQTEEGNAW
jgi:hypothetical protein